jgi:hypothetical protein
MESHEDRLKTECPEIVEQTSDAVKCLLSLMLKRYAPLIEACVVTFMIIFMYFYFRDKSWMVNQGEWLLTQIFYRMLCNGHTITQRESKLRTQSSASRVNDCTTFKREDECSVRVSFALFNKLDFKDRLGYTATHEYA